MSRGMFDWEGAALRLLEMNLNGDSLNTDSLKDLFAESPHILDDLDITNDGEAVQDLDRVLYGGRPQIIEIRELKPTQIHHCKACNRSFKRADNFRRHLMTELHKRRQRKFESNAQLKHEEKLAGKSDEM